MKGITVAYHLSHLGYRKIRGAQQFTRLIHAVLDQEILWAFCSNLFKQFAEIRAV